MYIVVVGGGKVGFHLTKALMNEGQEVLVIEKDPLKVSRITRILGATALQGDGAEVDTLEQAGLNRADVVAAVTGHDEDNLIICQVAKARFDVPRTVARINNPRNEFIFAKLGIDATVSATQVILAFIQQSIPKHPFVHLLTVQEEGIEFVELQLTDESPAAGCQAGEVALPPDTAIPLLIRSGRPIVVQADTVFEADDRLVAVTTSEQEKALRRSLLGAAA
ncbi:MAG TPA: NAD-binding protein [Chloroflexota bacterium]|nr:NAD-binding protein [Chloroflexota bacterium]